VADRGLTGVLLVGGASARFGSPKALARVGSRTLAEIGWETLAFCDERIAVGKKADGLELPFPVLDDGADVRAPIAGVLAGLRAARHDRCLVLPVDVPRIDPESLRALAARGGDVAVSQAGPLPGAYRKSVVSVLDAAVAARDLSLRRAIAGLDVRVVQLDDTQLVNVNTPDDLRELTSGDASHRLGHGDIGVV
jgi:molybdopterin-guanine dinucleotide biosynthesis protein A